ncbi:nucleotidyl transferase AbiEii/AbiGii toxin family protein [Steroidobacter agaridevorans]|nr:nucleotidyl transferase AbiEii/AbiGii toxin family protein [Steroidobacter agaridevorans]
MRSLNEWGLGLREGSAANRSCCQKGASTPTEARASMSMEWVLAGRVVLGRARLMLAWMGDTFRPTRDADMIGFGDVSPESLAKIFAETCAVPVEPDAMTYLADTLRLEPIRLDDDYGGHRATLMARMGAARLRVQVDIGVGDAVVPAPRWVEYPSLLDLPKPRLRAYTPATVVAEKFHAIYPCESEDRNSPSVDS